ncbi:MAG: 30S ribosomal protein S2, partial [Pseudomonadota bacterium]
SVIDGMASQLGAAGFDLGELEDAPVEEALADPGEAVDPPAEEAVAEEAPAEPAAEETPAT